MTLKRQLLIAISMIFFVVFAGLQMLSVLSTKDFLRQQLASHAQDAATSLSRSIEDALSKNDKVLAEIQITSVFDRGYYQKIILVTPLGEKVVVKELPVNVENVPIWFSSLLPLDTPPGEAFITSGWRQLGKVIVVSQPTFAYQYLWTSFKNAMWWMISTYLIALALTILLLRLILNPLLQIENAAIEIKNKRFIQIDAIPSARELKRVVIAMNAMSGKISEILDAEIAKADTYRKEAYTDKVTGLDNRQGFDLRFNHLLSEKNFTTASIFILEIDGLREYNNIHGYRAGDAVLTSVSDIVHDFFKTEVRISGRIGGAAFAFVCIDTNFYLTMSHIRDVHRRLGERLQEIDTTGCLVFSIGGAEFTPDRTRGEIFSKADMAIETTRQNAGRDVAVFRFDDANRVEGSLAWRTLIQNSLSESRWVLFAQPVISLSDRALFQHEMFSRLVDVDGSFVSAGKFMPMALRHQLMEEIDKAVITLTFDLLSSPMCRYQDVAVNISVQSVGNQAFNNWLEDKLQSSKEIAKSLCIELSEFSCIKNLITTREFVLMLRKHKVRFGVDHFGLDAHSLEVLRQVPPDYIKLDGGLVKGILENSHAHDHLKSIIQLAKSLEIPIVAQNVESEELRSLLFDDSVSYGQGYYLGAPEKA